MVNDLDNEKQNCEIVNKPLCRRVLFVILSCIPAVIMEIAAILAGNNVSDPIGMYCVLTVHGAVLLSIVISQLGSRIPLWVKWVFAAISPFCAYLATEGVNQNPFSMDADIVFLNIFFFYIAAAALIFITGRTAPAIITVTLVPFVLSLINCYTVEFRGSPLFPWDLASYGTAASVLSEYTIVIWPKVALAIGAAVFICSTSVHMNIRVKFPIRPIRPILAAVFTAALIASGMYAQTDAVISDFGLYPYLFTPTTLYNCNGFTVSFLMNLRYTTVPRPDGYDTSALSAAEDEYVSDAASDAEEMPNVIVIMNESFSDLSVIGDFTTNMPYMPFIDSLEENTQKGKLHVSIVGGNTPNSEFEFLTGLSLGYLPAGSIPYQQYVTKETPSLALQLSSLGYRTIAMHAYASTGWKRNTVYPLLGFDESYFTDTDDFFAGASKARAYIKDESLYERLIDLYESHDSDDPLFIFAVTMQNHGGYAGIYNNFVPEVSVDGFEDNEYLSNYFSLVRESDRAFGELIEYFENTDEPTVVLMFGDHQPNTSVTNTMYKNFGGGIPASTDIERSESNYIVPYVIWSNTELSGETAQEISANYLSTVLVRSAGLPMTGSQKLLSELMTEYPVITGRTIIDSDGNYYPVTEYGMSDELKLYGGLEYSVLFDRKYAPLNLWSLK